MRKIMGLGLVGVLSLVLASPVHADGGLGSGSRGVQGGMHGTGSQHRGGLQRQGAFQHRGAFNHRGAFHRGCCWGGAFVGWPVGTSLLAAQYDAYPYSYPVYQEPVYAPALAYQPQQQMYLAPPAQSEQCYPGGCYRLQGDGVSAPFQWVWMPTVPAPPPAPPAAPPAPADPASSRPAQQLYRWVDDQGVANWTNNREVVPERYRTQLKKTL
jgi:hypothetical protein